MHENDLETCLMREFDLSTRCHKLQLNYKLINSLDVVVKLMLTLVNICSNIRLTLSTSFSNNCNFIFIQNTYYM